MLIPINGTALVELYESGSGGIETPDKEFKSYEKGKVLAVAKDNKEAKYDRLLGKEVFFEQFKDSAQVQEEDKMYAFISLEDLKGYRS